MFLTTPSRNFIGDALALLLAAAIVTPFFTVYGLATFPKVSIDRDSIALKYAYVRRLFNQEEIAIDPKARIIRLPNGGRP